MAEISDKTKVKAIDLFVSKFDDGDLYSSFDDALKELHKATHENPSGFEAEEALSRVVDASVSIGVVAGIKEALNEIEDYPDEEWPPE